MKNLLLICSSLLVISLIASANLWIDLRAERQVNVELRAQMAVARAPGSEVSLPQSVIATQASTITAADTAAESPAVKSGAPQPRTEQQSALAAASATIAALPSVIAERDLMKEPEYRKARLVQTRMTIERSNPGVVEELGLSDKQAEQLFNILAEHQLAMTSDITSFSEASSRDPAAQMELMRSRSAKQEEALRSELGDGKYAQFQQYQQTTRPALTQVSTMGSTLSAAGQPLSEAQSRALTTAMLAEQQHQRQNTTPITLGIDPANPQRTALLREAMQKRREENDRGILDAAAPHLNAAQVQALRTQFEKLNAARNTTIRLSRDLQPAPASP